MVIIIIVSSNFSLLLFITPISMHFRAPSKLYRCDKREHGRKYDGFTLVRKSLLSTHSHDLCKWGEFDLLTCGPPARFSVHLANSELTLAWSVHKSRGNNVVHMWVQLKRCCVCECYRGHSGW